MLRILGINNFIKQKKIKLVKLEAEFQEKLNETKRKLELEYEDKMAHLKEEYKADMEKTENRYKELIANLEEQLNNYKSVFFDKEKAEHEIENLKIEIKVY